MGTASAVTTIPAGTINNYNMNTAGETYVLGGNVTAEGQAIQFGANGITLDGNGYTIFFANTTNGHGIYSNGYDNAIIKNVNIISRYTNISLPSSFGVYLYTGSTNITLDNVRAYSALKAPLYITTSNHYILNSSFISVSADAVFMAALATGVHFDNVSAISYSGHGFYTLSTSDIFENCYSKSTSGIGMRTLGSRHNLINCISESTSSHGFQLSSGFTTIDNITARSSGSNGMYVTVGNNIIRDSEMASVSSYGMYVTSSNNTFNDSQFSSDTYWAYKITNGNNYYNRISTLSNIQKSPTTNTQISVLGDSISAGGFSGTAYGGWGNNLSMLLGSGYTISNDAVSGETTRGCIGRINSSLDILTPEIVTIMYGTNDLFQSVPQQTIINNTLFIASEITSFGAKPYVCLTPPRNGEDNLRIMLNQNLTTQAESAGYTVINTYDAVDLVPNNNQYDGYNASNMGDLNHPNNVGNVLIANKIYSQLILDYPPTQYWYDWNPANESCNAKVQITNSTPLITWNITSYNVTNGNTYKIISKPSGTIAGSAVAADGQASIIIVGLADGLYWLTETSNSFINPSAIVVVIIGAAGAFVGGNFINKWYRRRRGS
jgi:acyl-CoA thioesterase-1